MTKTITKCLTFVLAAAILPGCHSHYRPTAYSYVIPKQLSDGMLVAAMYNAGMDTGKIVALTKLILADHYPNIHSMLIVRHSKLIYENYFAGEDQHLGKDLGYVDHTMDDLHDCRSISKSFTSACIGIAVKQGLIKSIDEPIFPYFKDYGKYFDPQKRKITIRNLLTMTSGLDWDEKISYLDPKNSEIQMDKSNDPVAFILSRKMVSAPGTIWNYCAGCPQLLEEILWKATGERLDKYAEKNLFTPLGIKKYTWVFIAKDMPAAAWGLLLSSRDLAKFGLLYMNMGKWGNTQLLDSAWVNQSLSPAVSIPTGNPKIQQDYGFQFWIEPLRYNNYATPLASAVGNGGQYIFLWRAMDIIIVFTAGNYNRRDIANDAYAAVYQYVIPSVKEMQPYLE